MNALKTYKFPCGCEFQTIGPPPNEGELPSLKVDINDVPENCPATWDLLSQGYTKGVFQLETYLGKQWSQKLKPENLEHLSALGALLRPGCLKAKDSNGISMTEHYCRRKNKQESVEYYHEALKPILHKTYASLVFQEDSMRIAQNIAGFDLKDADRLRKSLGHKLSDEMAQIKKIFLQGAKEQNIVNEHDAEEIFGWIEKGQRYLFCQAHATAYGINGYISAYLKTHFPIQFYTSYLYYAKDKQNPHEEINELVNDAHLMGVDVLPPSILNVQKYFYTNGKEVYFGLANIKGVGEKQIERLSKHVLEVEQFLLKFCPFWTWLEWLIYFVNSSWMNVIERLIKAGSFRHLKIHRTKLLAELNTWSQLTDKEREWAKLGWKDCKDLPEILDKMAVKKRSKKDPPKYIGGASANKNRTEKINSLSYLLKNPPTSLGDNPEWIVNTEQELLGIALTCHRVDSHDTSSANSSCKDFFNGKIGNLILAVEINGIREVTCKNGKSRGKRMAFLTVSDHSCMLDTAIAFPDVWSKFNNLLQEKNVVLIYSQLKEKGGSLIIQKVKQI